MDRVTRFFSHDPITVVEFILAIFGVVGSIIIMTISLNTLGVSIEGTPSAAVQAITSSVGILVLGLVALSYSIANIYGIVRRNLKVRSAALFTQILVRLYALIAGFLVSGLFPITWISGLTLLLVATVCYLTVRRKISHFRVVGK
jgi:hypothetical protein